MTWIRRFTLLTMFSKVSKCKNVSSSLSIFRFTYKLTLAEQKSRNKSDTKREAECEKAERI